MDKQYQYWQEAGQRGYGKTYYANKDVERYSLNQVWKTTIHAAEKLGLDSRSKVLEVGCGDGLFANQILAFKYNNVQASDYAPLAIKTAKAHQKRRNVHFSVADVTKLSIPKGRIWDGIFMLGILHHVKPKAQEVIYKISKISPVVIVAEPNGDSPIRKAFEVFIPSYRLAQEQSFGFRDIKNMFSRAGYEMEFIEYTMTVPWFTPSLFLPIMIRIENFMHASSLFNIFKSTLIYGFRRKKYSEQKSRKVLVST